VIARDGSFDGQFYYSVETTGVYCRPSCAARLAKRSNVRFHDTRADAERAASAANRTGRRLPSYMRRWSHKPAD
jgi:methylphosphotriester-DNA--protein-cysteine methyltransferase